MQKTYAVVKIPQHSNENIEIPRPLMFSDYDEAFRAFVQVVKQEEDVLIPIERPGREEAIERFTGRSLIQIWICTVPDWNTEKHMSYGI